MSINNTAIQSIATRIFLAAGQQAVTTMVFCNVSTQTNLLSVYAVPFGANPGPSTQIVSEVILPPNETFAFDSERFVLEDNDAFYAACTYNNGVTSTISSVTTT